MKKRRKKIKKDPNEMTLLEHIEELRIRLIWIILGVAVGFVGTFSFSKKILNFAIEPLKVALPHGSRIIFTGVTEAFITRIEIALVAAIIVTIPFTFYQIWLFIKPGLKENEKRFVIPFVLAFSIFFLAGVAFAFKVVLPIGFKFLLSYGGQNLTAMPSIKPYIHLLIKILIGFGIVFELPVVTFILARLGIVDARWFIKHADYALLIIFIVAAILTPPDVFSQLLMAIPLVCLYLISIAVAWVFGKKKEET